MKQKQKEIRLKRIFVMPICVLFFHVMSKGIGMTNLFAKLRNHFRCEGRILEVECFPKDYECEECKTANK